MSGQSEEEFAEGLDGWLKKRRDEHQDHGARSAINGLLDEVRDASVVGLFPWQERESGE